MNLEGNNKRILVDVHSNDEYYAKKKQTCIYWERKKITEA